MGFQDQSSQGIWAEYAHEFPVRRHLTYLNHAAVAPLPERARAAMRWLADDAAEYGSLHYDRWLEAYEGVRVATARMTGARRDEIALVKNTSEGILTVALGMDWKAGDKIVAFHEEFPANYYIWKKLEVERGLQVEWLSCEAGLDEIDRACVGARLLAISFVQYLSGYRAGLAGIGAICKNHKTFFLVDAIQGLGVFPLDVEVMNIDAFAADGHKWLLGPEGAGVLYVRQEWQDRIEPVEFGWTNVAGYADYASRDMTLRSDAGRYECGTLNTSGCFGLRASMELLLEAGIERVSTHVQALGDRIAAGARERGWEVLGQRTPDAGAGIVCIRKPGIDSRWVYARLREQGFLAAPRQGWVRLSPHFYVSPEDIERLLEALPESGPPAA